MQFAAEHLAECGQSVREDYRRPVDLREIARARRRRQGLEALDFERDRAAALREQLEETITELEGASVDDETFARMAPEDVDIVRHTLFDMGDGFEPGVDGETDDDWLAEFIQGESPEVDREERLERGGEARRRDRRTPAPPAGARTLPRGARAARARPAVHLGDQPELTPDRLAPDACSITRPPSRPRRSTRASPKSRRRPHWPSSPATRCC